MHEFVPALAARRKAILDAYVQAGRELALAGRIRWRTARRANQEAIPIPFFALLKRLRPVKRAVLARAREQRDLQRRGA